MKNLFHMDWKTAENEIANADAIIISIGSVEQHGYHLPLGTDTIITEKILEKVTEDKKIVYYPAITFGQTWSSSTYPGTISISENSLLAYLECVIESLQTFKPKKIILYTFHRGNEKVITEYCRRNMTNENLYHIEFFNIYDYVKEKVDDHKFGAIWHAGEIETSLMLYIDFESVNLDKFEKNEIVSKVDISKVKEIKWKEFNSSGSWGDASLATFEKGEFIFNTLVNKISDSINFIIKQK